MDELISYLSERLTENLVFNCGVSPTGKDLKNWLREALKAFQVNENQTIVISGGDCPDCGAAMKQGTGVLCDDYGNSMDVGQYECPECSHILYY